MTTDNAPTVLSRYAKAIASVVEAGGPEPDYGLCTEDNGDVYALKTPYGQFVHIDAEPLGIAVLEKYVREDVVVWASKDVCQVAEPMYIGDDTWLWEVEYERYSTNDGTHTIQFLEMLAEVVAGEKGEVVIEHADLKRELLGGDDDA